MQVLSSVILLASCQCKVCITFKDTLSAHVEYKSYI